MRFDHAAVFPLGILFAAALMLAGCAQQRPATVGTEASFDDAVNAAIDDLFAQTQKIKLPAFVARLEAKVNKRALVIDPVVDAGSGNQTVATRKIDDRVAERVTAGFPAIEVLPFRPANVEKAQYLLTGTMTRTGEAQAVGYRIELALTDTKSGLVVAQSKALARAAGVDMTPTPYFRDSPVLVKDQVVDGSIATARTPAGQAASRPYFERMPVGALIAEAISAYDAGRIEEARTLYLRALETPGGDQIRVHNGLYLTNLRLGRNNEAEDAFGRVVATGISTRSLGVKFLFKADSTDFWPDPKVSSAYDFWLRQIARQVAASKACLRIVGHTSRTGSEQYNDQLSQRRALYIRQRLETEAAVLGPRMRASGVGFRENIIGTGTDDLRDALDRRVEFRIDDC